MGGKAAILLVLGFSIIFMVMGYNFGSLSTRAVDNYSDYYIETKAHNIAVSGANLAANRIFLDQSWTQGYNNLDFQGGKINANVTILDAFQNIRKLTVTGTYQGISKTIEVQFQPSKFSKFAYFSEIEGNIWWTTGDTVWGPLHIQDWLRVSGSPVFMGKVTVKKDLWYYSHRGRSDNPKFYGGYESGVSMVIPNDKVRNYETYADNGGVKITGQSDVYLTFDGDSIKYKYSSAGSYTTVLASDFAPNGVIYVKNGNLHLKGTVKGKYTVSAWGSSSGLGRVYLDDDIVYNTDPRVNPNSPDLLGIVARNEILVTDNSANRHDINIEASLYSENQGFGAENYSTRPNCGYINLYGGIVQKKRQPVGTFNWYGINSGFSKRYKYDDRFMLASPPYFPGTGSLEIVSWYE